MAAGLAVSLIVAAAVGLGVARYNTAESDIDVGDCAMSSGWSIPGGESIDGDVLLDGVARRTVVLLGERHDSPAHHQWQLDTLRALHARRPSLVLGLEMFPRRVQPALDAWVRGELDEAEFLAWSDWANVWRFDPDLYMDIFRYAREHAIPMRALNVEATLTRSVGRAGFEATPVDQREGVTRPAEASKRYARWLGQVYRMHRPPEKAADGGTLAHFIDAQLVWDRAMAQAIRDAVIERPDALVVGLIGSGHLRHGDGVAHQLDDLGMSDHATLLPWDPRSDCRSLVAGVAHAIYVVKAAPAPRAAPPG